MMLYDPFSINYLPNKKNDYLIVTGNFRYPSTIDDISNLYAHYAFKKSETTLPIVILMHGYTQDSNSMTTQIMKDMAEYGFFACAVGMRARDGATGNVDVSGRELYDIIDAVEYVKQKFSTVIDENQIHVAGYSGGGGNVFGLAAKFPDYFNSLISHFGISDYGYDTINSWWATNPSRRTSLENWIGFNPTNNLGAYYSRAHQYGVAKNLKSGFLWMFHDSEDTNVPPVQSQIVKEQMDIHNRKNYYLSITTPSDNPRWIHASPGENDPVRFTRDYWGSPIIDKQYPQWSVNESGEMLIQGYLKTKRFEIWLETGQEHVAELAYDVTTGSYTINPLSGTIEVSIKQGNSSASQTINELTTIIVS
ncbi:alpha/beta hydrolase family protein [Niallia circulans]|uniref:alpha/beta hydrolase family protein n=1 Tax=Niallia circulans TaxID=1397 RepID=UPI0026EB0061|nr:prolyl oligopeptidase family serine peptidase [Niallia circulans]